MDKLILLEKIFLLESKLGESRPSTFLEPFKFDSTDAYEVQKAGKLIAQHLGLTNLTFVITYITQAGNVGGHIQLDHSNEVFIEIDPRYKDDYVIVLYILAHEICHKYLQINGIKLFPEIENEILTDITTVFTGLGKLALNGCETKKTTVSRSFEDRSLKTTTTTNTDKLGYIDRHQFAFVYRLICEMRRVPEKGMYLALTNEADLEVRKVSDMHREYFCSKLFNKDYSFALSNGQTNNHMNDAQKAFAKFHRDIRVVEENILTMAQERYSDFHHYNKTATDKIQMHMNESFNKESQTYMKNVFVVEQIEVMKQKVGDMHDEMKKLGNALPKLIDFTNRAYPSQNSQRTLDFLFHFECPACHNQMRIGDKKLAKVKCSKCAYSFIIDTGTEEIYEPKSLDNGNKNKLWKRVMTFFGRGAI